MISRIVLIPAEAFGRIGAAQVGETVAAGVRAGGFQADVCPLAPAGRRPGEPRALLDSLDFDVRMRRARAVVLAVARLEISSEQRGMPFEIATRARQAGVPAYAISRESTLDPFQQRMLDLQVIIRARGGAALRAAAEELAQLL